MFKRVNFIIEDDTMNSKLEKEYKQVNKDIKALNDNLINALQSIGIEFIDMDAYINRYDALMLKKNKLMVLIALQDK